jgi:uncharacterized membrane protein
MSEGPRKPTWSRLIRESFLAGLLVLAPLGITLYILWFVFDHVDAPLGDEINEILRDSIGLDYHIPGLGILATLVIVFAIGALTRLALFRWLLRSVQRLIDLVPVVRSLYAATRQIVVPFTEKDALPFSEVVMVEYPMPGRFTLGMVARQRVSDDPHDDRLVVFFPSNHLHLGYPVILRRSDVRPIEMTVEDAIKFFVSCGVIGENDLFALRTGPPRHAVATDPQSRTESVRS